MNSNNNYKVLAIALMVTGSMTWNTVAAQVLTPVKWSYAAKKTGSKEAVVYLKAAIEDGWHIYSTRQKDGGPVKTTFSFTTQKQFLLLGPLKEPVPVRKYEKVFEMEVLYFERSVVYQQKIGLKAGQAIVSGTVEFMVCNDQKCLPPEELAFSIPVK